MLLSNFMIFGPFVPPSSGLFAPLSSGPFGPAPSSRPSAPLSSSGPFAPVPSSGPSALYAPAPSFGPSASAPSSGLSAPAPSSVPYALAPSPSSGPSTPEPAPAPAPAPAPSSEPSAPVLDPTETQPPILPLPTQTGNHSKVLLLDEITVDLDVLARADLLTFLKKECEALGATIIYATHIFDGLENWPSHIVYVAHGKLQLASTMEEVKKMSNLSLMRTVDQWLRKERDKESKRRKERKANGLAEFDRRVDGTRVSGDPVRVVNNVCAAGRLNSIVAGEENFVYSSNMVIRQ